MLVIASFRLKQISGLEEIDLKNDQEALMRVKDNISHQLLSGTAVLYLMREFHEGEDIDNGEEHPVDIPNGLYVDVVMELFEELVNDYNSYLKVIAEAAADAITNDTWRVAHHYHVANETYLGFMSY
jgi:hypothetical protein